MLDNLESLLTDDGAWRDARWGMVVSALAGNQGLCRLVLTPGGLSPGWIARPDKAHARAVRR